MEISYFIYHLGLIAHPEGGYYKENYRSRELISESALPKRFNDERCFGTAIYFLLDKNNFSAFHKIKSDELWHFYAGHTLEVIEITELGELKITPIGNDLKAGEVFQYMVPANTWFGSRVKAGGEYSLVGCTVSPGFDFADFEMVSKDTLQNSFPQHKSIIAELTRF